MDYIEYRKRAERKINELVFINELEFKALGFESKGIVCPKLEVNDIKIDFCPTSMDIFDVILPDGKHLHEVFDIPRTDDGEYYDAPEAAKFLYESIGLINPDD